MKRFLIATNNKHAQYYLKEAIDMGYHPFEENGSWYIKVLTDPLYYRNFKEVIPKETLFIFKD